MQHSLHHLMQSLPTGPADLLTPHTRINTGKKEHLGRVQIANPSDRMLIEQGHLHRSRRTTQSLAKTLTTDHQSIWPKTCLTADLLEPLGIDEAERAESASIPEEQLVRCDRRRRAREPQPNMLLRGRHGHK